VEARNIKGVTTVHFTVFSCHLYTKSHDLWDMSEKPSKMVKEKIIIIILNQSQLIKIIKY
jgi:hypothetical protein